MTGEEGGAASMAAAAADAAALPPPPAGCLLLPPPAGLPVAAAAIKAVAAAAASVAAAATAAAATAPLGPSQAVHCTLPRPHLHEAAKRAHDEEHDDLDVLHDVEVPIVLDINVLVPSEQRSARKHLGPAGRSAGGSDPSAYFVSGILCRDAQPARLETLAEERHSWSFFASTPRRSSSTFCGACRFLSSGNPHCSSRDYGRDGEPGRPFLLRHCV